MKRFFIFIGLVLLVLGIVEYIKHRQEFINSLDIIFQLLDEEEVLVSQKVKIYLLNEDNIFEEIDVEVSANNDDLVSYIFELYTSKSNSLPLGYYTPINVSTTICNLSYDEKVINLIVSDDFYRSTSLNSFYGLVWSYYSLGFKEINIYTTTGTVETLRFNDYRKINLVIESSQKTASLTTVFFPTVKGVRPATFLHDEFDQTNYILEKIFDDAKIDSSKIEISQINSSGKLYLDIKDSEKYLTDNIILAIRRSLVFNNLYDDVIIIKNSEVFS